MSVSEPPLVWGNHRAGVIGGPGRTDVIAKVERLQALAARTPGPAGDALLTLAEGVRELALKPYGVASQEAFKLLVLTVEKVTVWPPQG